MVIVNLIYILYIMYIPVEKNQQVHVYMYFSRSRLADYIPRPVMLKNSISNIEEPSCFILYFVPSSEGTVLSQATNLWSSQNSISLLQILTRLKETTSKFAYHWKYHPSGYCLPSLLQFHCVSHPLPNLRTRDLCCRWVLYTTIIYKHPLTCRTYDLILENIILSCRKAIRHTWVLVHWNHMYKQANVTFSKNVQNNLKAISWKFPASWTKRSVLSHLKYIQPNQVFCIETWERREEEKIFPSLRNGFIVSNRVVGE